MNALSRGRFIAVGAAACATPLSAAAAVAPAYGNPKLVAQQVRGEFLYAWNGYKRAAWGYDEVRPITGTGHDFFIKGHSFGLSIIEALDTLYVMGLDDELTACVEWLRKNLHFDVDGEVEMFEAMIRMVAGLIAGYYATGERFMLDGARDLADRLLQCFSKSPTGVPYRYVNLHTGAVRGNPTNLAEAGSNILEFGDLTRLTGDPKYLAASKKSYETIIAKRSPLNLLGTYFDVEKGEFTTTDDVAPEPPVDSFFEYLYGAWKMFGDTQARDWYRMLTDAVLKYQVVRFNGHLWFQTVDYTTGLPTGDHSQWELAAFYAELLAKGGDRATGSAYYDSWTAAAKRYGIIPEGIDSATWAITDPGYEFRPEYVNSAFDLWFLTHDEKYRRTAHDHFLQIKANCKVPGGYTILKDVRTRPMTQGDLFPAYAFSENFKYLYLMFADSPRFDGSNYLLNTEGKVMRGLLKDGKPIPQL